jgi:hypothetical protein
MNWKKFRQVKTVVRIIIMNMGQKVLYPLLRINIHQFATAHKGVVNGRILFCVIIAAEETALPSYFYRTYTIFHEIIINAVSSIQCIARQQDSDADSIRLPT